MFVSVMGTGLAVTEPMQKATATPVLPDDQTLLSLAEYNINAYKEHYQVLSVDVTSKFLSEVRDDSYDVDFVVELGTILKYDSAAQLPHVKSMAECLGIDSTLMTVDALIDCIESQETADVLAAASTEMAVMSDFEMEDVSIVSADVARLATSEIASFIDELETLYIGQEDSSRLPFRATFNLAGEPVAIGAIGFSGATYDATKLVPSTTAEMCANGVAQVNSIVQNAIMTVQTASAASLTDEKEVYHRVTARDYANTWTSNPTNGAKKDTSCWRISSNPNATAPFYAAFSSDCANYVSQAIYAGGIEKTTGPDVSDLYWYGHSNGASNGWANCGGLYNYFTRNNYWTESDFTWCNAGGVIFLINSAGNRTHVVMCVKNDTAERRFSAHTTDHQNEPYTEDTFLGGETKSLEYWVFTNSTAD